MLNHAYDAEIAMRKVIRNRSIVKKVGYGALATAGAGAVGKHIRFSNRVIHKSLISVGRSSIKAFVPALILHPC
jgi:hypothetical protein